jgi:endogenous inhibitor of DNA gyrase (YacG/DUF329 family)
MRCPICDNEFDPAKSKAMPFCSDRCRTIDLGRWLDEGYGMPSVPDPDADELPETGAKTNGDA